MEKKHTCASICDHLPTLSANHPWLVDQNLEEDENKDHILYTTRDPLSQYRCRIPSFLGRRIMGYFYGWVTLSNHPRNDMWSLWNPLTSKVICLPRLISKNGDQSLNITQQCCLSSPPDDHASNFMITTKNRTIVFCLLRKRLSWVESSYAKQLRSLTGYDGFLFSLTCCNGKVYALNTAHSYYFVIRIDINVVVEGGEETGVVSLSPYMKTPSYYYDGCLSSIPFMKGCCTEVFYIELGLKEVGVVTKETVAAVRVFKLDMTNMRWEEMEDLKDAAFFLDIAHSSTVFYSPSGLGGYVHFLHRSGKVIHSCNFKNKTIALSSMPSFLEHRLLEGELIKCGVESQHEEDRGNDVDSMTHDQENVESRLVDIPIDVLKTIMEFCVGVEYLHFRATCKQCHLAAPMIRWSKQGGRLQTYSLVSPWLMVFEKALGIISFTDPMFGDKYYIKTPRELIGDLEIHCSMSGWLLIRRHKGPLMFFNPFTSDIRELPHTPYLDTYCFSAPPTSSDCMVIGFTTRGEWPVYVHSVAREPSWGRFQLNLNFSDDGSHSSFHFATYYNGRNLYALYKNGGLGFMDIDNRDYTLQEGPRSCCSGSTKQNFLMKCDQQLLQVTMGEFGECVEVFKLDGSTGWEKMESLGRHAIYICGRACLCIEAKTPEMANRIYLPRVHSENKKIVFYSLETRRYHTSNFEESFGDFMGTTHHIDPHVWIEPSWSS